MNQRNLYQTLFNRAGAALYHTPLSSWCIRLRDLLLITKQEKTDNVVLPSNKTELKFSATFLMTKVPRTLPTIKVTKYTSDA